MTPAESALGYLVVLNNQGILSHLNVEEQRIGNRNIMGCLVELEQYLERDGKAEVLNMVRLREKINGEKPHGDPHLEEATGYAAGAVLAYYRGLNVT